jgi:arylsulfatase
MRKVWVLISWAVFSHGLFAADGQEIGKGQGIIPYAAKAPDRAPNVLLIMTDDVGFGASSTFGGPVPTPTLDRLAHDGLRYNRFHTTALCSPSRAALLTGRNHDSVGTPSTMEPRINSVLPKSAGTIAAVLRANGYNTAFFGKHHNVPLWESGPFGPFDRWPTGLGFDYFFGFVAGDVNQWAPALYRNTNPVEPPANDPTYHFERALADDATSWLYRQRAIAPEKPFFIYYAPAAAHSPHHAPKEWIAKFKGQFDQGWDRLTEETLARQKALHIVPENTRLTPRPAGIPAWNSLSADQRRLYARMMEAFAAQLSYSDHEVGHLIDAIRDAGQLDNTLIIFVEGDNGGSAEGSLQGTANNIGSYLNGVPESLDYLLSRIDDIGGPKTLNHFPAGWGWATNTPFRWTKQIASHFGGNRNGLVISWPQRIKKTGELRSQFHHLIDVMPTILEATGIAAPAVLNGVPQQPIEGISMAYTFDSATAPGRRKTQYFSIGQTKGIYHEGWFASTTPMRMPWTPWPPGSLGEDTHGLRQGEHWELYHIDEDFNQATDVAARYPEKLKEMQALWKSEAGKYGALETHGIHHSARDERSTFVFHAGAVRIPEAVAPDFHNRSFAVTAEIEVPQQGAEGVIATIGGRFGGWGFLVMHNKPVLIGAYSEQPQHKYRIASDTALAPGKRTVRFEFAYDGGGFGKGGEGRISVDGKTVAEGRIEHTLPVIYSLTETFDVGRDTGTPVIDDYQLPFAFTGAVDVLKVDLQKHNTAP